MFITKNSLPDLSSLLEHKAISIFIVHQLVGVDKDFPPQMASYRRNFVRLADKALRDYLRVYELIEEELAENKKDMAKAEKEGQFLYAPLIFDAIEDCFITLGRLFRYFERIRADKSALPLEKIFKKQMLSLESSIREMRNFVEHLDEDIASGKVRSGVLTAPMLNEDTTLISLAGAQLPTSALATAVKHFHEFAQAFATFRVDGNGNYEPYRNA